MTEDLTRAEALLGGRVKPVRDLDQTQLYASSVSITDRVGELVFIDELTGREMDSGELVFVGEPEAEATYVTEISVPTIGGGGIQRLHSRMPEPEPLPNAEVDLEPEAEL